MWLQEMIGKLLGGRGGQGGVFARRLKQGRKRASADAGRLEVQVGSLPAALPAVAPIGRGAMFRRVSALPGRTGPLELLHGRDVLVLCDVDNLSLGARDLGYKVSYRKLAELLHRSSRSCQLHAFFPGSRGKHGRTEYFAARGWTVHMNEIEVVYTYHGPQRLSNSDSLILLWAGWLAAQRQMDLVVVASGDGSLGCDIARFLAGREPACQVITLSLVGSTSCRLDARTNPYVWANLALGKDALRPAAHRGAEWTATTAAGLRSWCAAPTKSSKAVAVPMGGVFPRGSCYKG